MDGWMYRKKQMDGWMDIKNRWIKKIDNWMDSKMDGWMVKQN